MKNLFRNFTAFLFLLITVFSFSPAISAQDRVTVNREIRFARGSISARVSNQISRGTMHIYRVRARAGQQMAVVLRTGNRTSFTIVSNRTGILEGADGVKRTLVELPESGVYEIQIGTDATAGYTLEVTIN
jgi:hypothetical protein